MAASGRERLQRLLAQLRARQYPAADPGGVRRHQRCAAARLASGAMRVEPPGLEPQNAIGGACGRQRMRDQNGACARGMHLLAQQLQDLSRGARIEIAGRLIGQHQARLVHQGARDRNALQLTARELARVARARAPRCRSARASGGPASGAAGRATPSNSSGSATFCSTVRYGSTWKA